MKTLIKSFVTLAVASLLSFNAVQAATYSTNITGISTNILLNIPANITAISVSAATLPTGTNAVLYFYDNNTNDIVYTNAAWVSRTTVSTNVSTVFTNQQGIVQTNSYPGQYTTLVTNAAATNTLPLMTSFSVPANSTQEQTLQVSAIKGAVVKLSTQVTNVSITVTYQPTFGAQ